ncbi:MAG: isoprenylcysteine carboxylmethyltransferase family protein [Planctomycetes bacterium]|nr:isoprenylcysteine carboxylmethyltransferase family protein [Planctomycetota bacterium]
MILIKTLLFIALAPGSIVALIPWAILWSARGGVPWPPGPWNWPGLAMIAAGAFIAVHSMGAFAFLGKGTPVPIDPPRFLVRQGFYQAVRNPMYVGILGILVGESVLFSSPRLLVYAAAVGVMFHLFVVLYEEPTLGKKFGSPYEDYCRSVPRWIPRAASIWPLQQ